MNLRPSGYEPDELPDCSTPRRVKLEYNTAAECSAKIGPKAYAARLSKFAPAV